MGSWLSVLSRNRSLNLINEDDLTPTAKIFLFDPWQKDDSLHAKSVKQDWALILILLQSYRQNIIC